MITPDRAICVPKILKLNKIKLFQDNMGTVRIEMTMKKLQIWLKLEEKITNL